MFSNACTPPILLSTDLVQDRPDELAAIEVVDSNHTARHSGRPETVMEPVDLVDILGN